MSVRIKANRPGSFVDKAVPTNIASSPLTPSTAIVVVRHGIDAIPDAPYKMVYPGLADLQEIQDLKKRAYAILWGEFWPNCSADRDLIRSVKGVSPEGDFVQSRLDPSTIRTVVKPRKRKMKPQLFPTWEGLFKVDDHGRPLAFYRDQAVSPLQDDHDD
jgi:hypothetical protein